ncbi:LysR substrate-binding domain-containing protein [Tumidithrix elongata RA019]|uniref:LysR substrate-binding domain-containing protein n=1 Tax=Tumidithrix elongata BACA0141 TaxID=2716417 RepID=A0AAW9Q983_9CYAN|nr:LysR substrate-binding domain-containing protein [Tumidithrix elongata RA019]
MTLDQLRIFLAVAEHLHFTRAAEVLYITQPAVSAAIQSLESEYGAKLFHRIGRRIEVTEAGLLLQVEAQKILDQVALTERGLRELNNMQRGELKLGSSLTIGNYWLPYKISEFQRQYPQISVNCTLANTEEICEGTAAGLFDLGLIEGEVQQSLQDILEPEVIDRDRMRIIVGKSHPWFQRIEVSVDELKETTWVMRESGSGSQQVFERALHSWGIDPRALNTVLILASGEMIKAIVESSEVAAAISELMVAKEMRLSILRSIQVVDNQKGAGKPLEIVRPFLKLKHKQRFQTRLSKTFEQILNA